MNARLEVRLLAYSIDSCTRTAAARRRKPRATDFGGAIAALLCVAALVAFL